MRGTSAKATLRAKEAYERLKTTHGDRVCAYRADNRRFVDPLLKEESKKFRQHTRYCGVGSHHQNEIVERRIKELTLGSRNLLLHATILWTEEVSTMLWHFYFNVACQR